jgi:hypothetical protein
MIKLTRLPCPNVDKLKNDYKYPENKDALKRSCNNKCMYCESEFDSTDYGDVEHIKPKIKFKDLKFDWENLGYSCVKCNRDNKKDEWDDNFINPFQINPEDHFTALGPLIWPKSNSIRGQVTKDILDLNRIQLVTNRSQRLIDLGNLITRYNELGDGASKNAVKNQILKEIEPDKEYSFVKKVFVLEVMK